MSPRTPPRAVWMAMFAIAVAGAAIAGYLTFPSVVTGQAPLGCGSGSGCEEVLASKWSKWLGIPVSGLATLVCGWSALRRSWRE